MMEPRISIRNIAEEPQTRTTEEVFAAWKDGFLLLFDVNPPRRWKQSHIPGAVSLDPGRMLESELPADKAAPLLFYCLEPRCGASRSAAKRAMAMGYTNAAYMPAGITGWAEANLPVETG
jgi:rhodanese-related sulfurtransferase